MEILASIKGKTRLVSVTYRTKESGELSRYTFLLGANYANAVRRDIAILRKRLARAEANSLRATALSELLASLTKTREVGAGNNPAYTQKETWERTEVPFVRKHKENGSLQLTGFRLKKVTIEKGVFPPDTRRELTKAKDEERKTLKTGRFRPFCITPENMEGVRAEGKEIIFG